MSHTMPRLRMTRKKYQNYLFLSLLLTGSLFASQSILEFEIVPFDYADADMKEQICAMVRDDQDIQNMTHETEESMSQQLLCPDLKYKNNCFVCRATDGSATIYGYMMYVMSDAAYLIELDNKEKSLLFNATYADEYVIIEPVADFVNFGFLDNFAVHKDYRGKGIVQAMLNYFEQDCRKNGLQLIALGVEPDNEKAKRAYRKFGFTTHPVHSIAMVKKLD